MADSTPPADTVAGWSIEQVVGQLFSVSVGHHTDGAYGFSDTLDATAELVAERHLGGVCYFPLGEQGSRPEMIRQHLDTLQACAEVPLLTSIDQEGGLVTRMREPATRWPSAMAQVAAFGVDETGVESIQTMARMSGEELRAAGVNHDFAPDADINTAPRNPVIGIRSASSNPDAVARFVAASVRGFAEAGVASCLKHFPGHGNTTVDSHVGLPVLDTTPEQWRDTERLPFAAGIEAGVDAIMIGHLCAPLFDPSGLPATFSRPIVTGLLREELGFEGIIVTDALDMAGAQLDSSDPDDWAPGRACILALQAGVDQLLMPRDPARCIDTVLAAVASGELDETQLRVSAARILALKERLRLRERLEVPAPEDLPREFPVVRHQRRAAMATSRALTWRDRATTLVLDPTRPVTVVHDIEAGGAGRGLEDVPAALVESLREHAFQASAMSLAEAAGTGAPDDSTVVLVTRDAWRSAQTQQQLRQLHDRGRLDLVLCARSPYDSLWVPAQVPVLLAFGDIPGVAGAVTDALIAGVALGTLPTDLPDPADHDVIRWRCALDTGAEGTREDGDRVRIRPYQPADHDALGRICVRTGASGADATGDFSDDQLLPWIYAYPYVEYAPELCLVVEADDQVVGYILGVADVRDFADWWAREWNPRFEARFPPNPEWNDRETGLVARALTPERMVAPWHEEHTAELHIDLLPVVQGMGLGRQLMDRFTALLRERGVTGVTLGVGGTNTTAVAFYRSLGFRTLRDQTDAEGRVTGYSLWLPTDEGSVQ